MEHSRRTSGPWAGYALVVPGLVAAACVGLLVAACARVMPGEPIDRPVAEVVGAAPDCTTSGAGFAMPPPTSDDEAPSRPEPPRSGSVPEGFVPTSVVECGLASTTVLDRPDGLWSSVTETTRGGDLGRLLAALSEPNGRSLPVCTADFELVADLWLVDASGASMRAAHPVDGCGKTTGDTRPAVAALPVSAERDVPVNLIESRDALDAGCSTSATTPTFVDANDLGVEGLPPDGDATDHDDGGATSLPAAPALPEPAVVDPADLDRVCLYRVAAPHDEPVPAGSPGVGDADAGFGSGSSVPTKSGVSATFHRVVPLDPTTAEALVEAMDGPPVGGDCSDRPTSIATLPLSEPGAWPVDVALTIELDGCRRLSAGGGQAHALPPVLAEALLVR
ncbi:MULTISPECIES: hypothetical protein [unclassified Frigoribacterium]|uniref:hypothetical protein n=1 Tax=unclassified Frigoribacterium TaxID=2627005 RepID=UPI000701D47B|nr:MULTISPECIES: hypothetical protein [unclassified Frigoribacterium]KQO46295.1 hypothetical protein ASF07_00480 [Frigoribacterium sp. Leaf254]KQT38388.1 hypothetical protein ASG28_00480 [Frigoribacterium sp. Leaf415]